ncbi:MAG TPA: tRNA lysidine(34) synthetase TilS [Rhodanobacteraceae bacterium]|nr:tRNA lysidine(34) synthetase TilS [Rhodanobacteraceae bacterium]
MTPTRLPSLLEAELAGLPSGPILVAFSGGLDSSVLLHALAASSAARARGLRAVHVDHRLHRDSANWSKHCGDLARSLGLDLLECATEVVSSPDLGPEASARRARYRAIEAVLAPGEILALAHHLDDQAETVLLKLLRGAGPEGLAAMRELRRFGPGFLWRPLLAVPRAVLRGYAEHHDLRWIDDPSNSDLHIARNFLRHEVLPHLHRHWPQAAASIAQSAVRARAAADFIDAEAASALDRMRAADPAIIDVDAWLALPDALRDPVLRRWLRALDLPEPNRFQVNELERQLATAGRDREPCVRWPGAEVRRYRGRLHALAPSLLPPPDWQAAFDGAVLELPAGLGSLQLVSTGRAATPVRLAEPLHARFRRGGERLRPAGSAHVRELRKLWQEAGVPPWQRQRTPLLFDARGELCAVGDRWLSAAAAALFEHSHCRMVFRRPGTVD